MDFLGYYKYDRAEKDVRGRRAFVASIVDTVFCSHNFGLHKVERYGGQLLLRVLLVRFSHSLNDTHMEPQKIDIALVAFYRQVRHEHFQ